MSAFDPDSATPPAAQAPATQAPAAGTIPPFTPSTPPPATTGPATFTPATFVRESDEELEAAIVDAYRDLVGKKPSDAMLGRLMQIVRRIEKRRHAAGVGAERAQHEATSEGEDAPATTITDAPSVATIVENAVGDMPEALAHGVSQAAESLRSILQGSKLSMGEFSG